MIAGGREVEAWLRETDDGQLAPLWRAADAERSARVGDAVHLRGLIEIANHCVRRCGYCGLAAPRPGLSRYRMALEEILGAAEEAARFGYGTVVLQSGEDPGLTRSFITQAVRAIRERTGLAVTLGLGERDDRELGEWREAGADRYLLRFETSNAALFSRIHPGDGRGLAERLAVLSRLRALGYEVGSGVMIGIPGQTWRDLAADIALFRTLDLDMIGVGPYLPHPDTPLGAAAGETTAQREQVPADELTVLKVIALARLACPLSNIPSTTALAVLGGEHGRGLGLQRGANVIMPNLTPHRYRVRYEIYPAKACAEIATGENHRAILELLTSLGRRAGSGPGESPNRRARRTAWTVDR